MATTIKSPQEGYTGTDTYGPLTLEFKDGVATTDETLSAGHKAYFKKLGFKVSGSRAQSTESADEGPFDPSKHSVDEVLAYLGVAEGHDPVIAGEFERVIQAEEDGKNRSTLLAAAAEKKAEWDAENTGNSENTEGGGN
ncbi:hypothetical protein [Glutamicibacter nicotianae]|uniref:hypothetical protein n=1 Tax=Glutamicibacter nicotianae TaxID=37929 RepID=UPI00195EFB60|nr:hypothetical protein [Glutamicibacter nicotianae]MBM7767354.1 hypothetical protein [Glutamicibacter nicotianae]